MAAGLVVTGCRLGVRPADHRFRLLWSARRLKPGVARYRGRVRPTQPGRRRSAWTTKLFHFRAGRDRVRMHWDRLRIHPSADSPHPSRCSSAAPASSASARGAAVSPRVPAFPVRLHPSSFVLWLPCRRRLCGPASVSPSYGIFSEGSSCYNRDVEHELSQYAADVVARRGVREEWLRRAFENPQQVQREAADPAMVHHPRRIGEA